MKILFLLIYISNGIHTEVFQSRALCEQARMAIIVETKQYWSNRYNIAPDEISCTSIISRSEE